MRDCSALNYFRVKRFLNDYLLNAISLSKVQSSADKTNYPNCTARDAITNGERKYSDGELHKQNAYSLNDSLVRTEYQDKIVRRLKDLKVRVNCVSFCFCSARAL